MQEEVMVTNEAESKDGGKERGQRDPDEVAFK